MIPQFAIAIFTTWTYGTWLPGDDRGWFQRGRNWKPSDGRLIQSLLRMKDDAITLNVEQRVLVEKTIADHCIHRKWFLHAVNCRTNHVHVVVTARNRNIDIPRMQFKAWCTRKLDEGANQYRWNTCNEWWTQRGWDDCVDDLESLEQVIAYVRDGQDFQNR